VDVAIDADGNIDVKGLRAGVRLVTAPHPGHSGGMSTPQPGSFSH
jgi:hypothetical protein